MFVESTSRVFECLHLELLFFKNPSDILIIIVDPLFYPSKSEYKLAHEFQCFVRAHQNVLEYIPLLIGKAVVACVVGSPTTAGVALLGWVLIRIAYGVAYQSGKVVARMPFFILGVLLDTTLMGVIGLWAIKEIAP